MLTVIVHLLILLVFANRYFLGTFLQKAQGARFDLTNDDFEPTVSIVIPMFNEGRSIFDTVMSLLRQEYPTHKLDIIVVDDQSTDDSYSWALEAAAAAPGRVKVIQNPVNMGKRRGINRAVREATSEIIVSVDSDVIVNADAVRQLVRRFALPDIVAVGGRVNVLNKHVNWLTRMQTIKYYFGYEYLKNVERCFKSVMCLSGCLTAYRRHVLIELEPILEHRNVLGVPIKYGEDRFLTLHYFSLAALMVAYPAVILHALVAGSFWNAMVIHVGVVAAFGALNRLKMAGVPEEDRVGPLNFLWMAAVMPVTYLLLTPLALFTLDSGSWETRGHSIAPPKTAPKPARRRTQPSLAGGRSS